MENVDHTLPGSPRAEDDGQSLPVDPEPSAPLTDDAHATTSAANSAVCVCEISTTCPLAQKSGLADRRTSNRIPKKDAKGIM
jgi:hypothetical protein